MNNNEELLELYRKNAALREQLKETDTANLQKAVVIGEAINELNSLIARYRPNDSVSCAIDEVIANLEDAIR
jgi:hypothetical protein